VTSQVLEFVELSDAERQQMSAFPSLDRLIADPARGGRSARNSGPANRGTAGVNSGMIAPDRANRDPLG